MEQKKFLKFEEYVIETEIVEESEVVYLKGKGALTPYKPNESLKPDGELRLYNEIIHLCFDENREQRSNEEMQIKVKGFADKFGCLGIDSTPRNISQGDHSNFISFEENEVLITPPVEKFIRFDEIHFAVWHGSFYSSPRDRLFINDNVFWNGIMTVGLFAYCLLEILKAFENKEFKQVATRLNALVDDFRVHDSYNYTGDSLEVTVNYDSLAALAVWQLKQDILAGMNIKQCENPKCRKYFTAKNPRAKYCIVPDYFGDNPPCRKQKNNDASNLKRSIKNDLKKGIQLETIHLKYSEKISLGIITKDEVALLSQEVCAQQKKRETSYREVSS